MTRVFDLLALRYLLRAVVRHHHAEHQPAQPQRQRQAARGALHLHEQRHRRGRRPPRGAPQGERVSAMRRFVTTSVNLTVLACF